MKIHTDIDKIAEAVLDSIEGEVLDTISYYTTFEEDDDDENLTEAEEDEIVDETYSRLFKETFVRIAKKVLERGN